MTDPLMASFCCKKTHSWMVFYDMIREIDSKTYNSICLISATCGILGAAYQILPQLADHHVYHWYWISSQRTRKIILWLAVSDLFASVGIFSRSLLNLLTSESLKNHLKTNSFNCYLLAFSIQYFYVVSWFWTLIYAIDMWLALKEKPSYPKIYHSLAWILPAFFTIIGLYVLYFPADRCFITTDESFWRLLPNYLVTYLPLLTVMIVNPILYCLSSASVSIIVSQYLAQYTNKERHIVDLIKIKFGLMNLTFLACWLPNITNAIIIFSSWNSFPQRVIIALWYIMAIMNPLQAFFNSLVYGKPANKNFCFWKKERKHTHFKRNEKTPLLLRKNADSFYTIDEPDMIL